MQLRTGVVVGLAAVGEVVVGVVQLQGGSGEGASEACAGSTSPNGSGRDFSFAPRSRSAPANRLGVARPANEARAAPLQ